jgi:hypothetical protein
VATEVTKDGVGYPTDWIIDRKGERLRKLPITSGQLSEELIPFRAWDKAKNRSFFGYLNTRGETVIEPRFDRASPFSKGLAQVRIHGANAYLDKQGRVIWRGKTRGDDRVTSYSGKSMLEMYRRSLGEENWRLARFYIQKMTRAELVKGSRITLQWLLQEPERTASTDVGRGGVIGMVAVAPFFQTYCRTFARSDDPIDPSPFRSMLLNKSLDIDFRIGLADCYGHPSFYATSWKQLAEDTEVLNKLVCDPREDEKLRCEAAQSNFRLLVRLYWKYRNETFKRDAAAGKRTIHPDIVGILGKTSGPFTAEQKTRWSELAAAMGKAVAGALKLFEETENERTRKVIDGLLKEMPDYHLLRNQELLTRLKEMRGAREGAKAISESPQPSDY